MAQNQTLEDSQLLTGQDVSVLLSLDFSFSFPEDDICCILYFKMIRQLGNLSSWFLFWAHAILSSLCWVMMLFCSSFFSTCVYNLQCSLLMN